MGPGGEASIRFLKIAYTIIYSSNQMKLKLGSNGEHIVHLKIPLVLWTGSSTRLMQNIPDKGVKLFFKFAILHFLDMFEQNFYFG
jgi:hypothetical protein